MGKGEIAHNEQFLIFPQSFLLNQTIVSPFVNILDNISLFAAELEDPKIGISGKGLIVTAKLSGKKNKSDATFINFKFFIKPSVTQLSIDRNQ